MRVTKIPLLASLAVGLSACAGPSRHETATTTTTYGAQTVLPFTQLRGAFFVAVDAARQRLRPLRLSVSAHAKGEGQLHKAAKATVLASEVVTASPNPHTVETTRMPGR